MKKNHIFIIFALIFGFYSGEVQSSLIINGSFETFNRAINDSPDNYQWEIITPSNDEDLPGWEVAWGEVDIFRDLPEANHRDGRHTIDLHGERPGALRTAFSTTAGKQYILEFSTRTEDDGLLVKLDGAEYEFGTFLFGKHSINFFASDAETTLTFRSRELGGSRSQGPELDNVRVFEVVASVPSSGVSVLFLLSGIFIINRSYITCFYSGLLRSACGAARQIIAVTRY